MIEHRDLQKAQQVVVASVDVNRVYTGKTAVSHAAERMEFDIVSMLLKAGADLNLTGDKGIPALIAAATYGRDVEVIGVALNSAEQSPAPLVFRTVLEACNLTRLLNNWVLVMHT